MDDPDRNLPREGRGEAASPQTSADRQAKTADDDPSWTFAKAADELTIVRPKDSHGRVLVVTMNESSRAFNFRDETASARFQADMESFLMHSGWSFVGFLPERRTPRDRRQLPRLTERRRWWTDGWLFFGD